MNASIIQKAAVQFGKGLPEIQSLGNGLIHRTYKVHFPGGDTIVLQRINQTIFKQPENIIQNYLFIQNHLLQHGTGITVPALHATNHGRPFWTDEEGNLWRATTFIANTYTPVLPANSSEVTNAAKSFATFTNALNGLNKEALNQIIPGFHDLNLRYNQFEAAVKAAHINRLLKSTHIISEMRDRQPMVNLYNNMVASPSDYPVRIMHHDCKISNILFDATTKQPVCPVDLDTVMPGLYFSDLGDMIRTMACTEDENSSAWEEIDVRKDYYGAIINGYLQGMGNNFTAAEKKHIHQAGLFLTFMQCLRYVTDFLNNDVYYQTTYPEQNLNRALNQLILLEKLEEHVGTL